MFNVYTPLHFFLRYVLPGVFFAVIVVALPGMLYINDAFEKPSLSDVTVFVFLSAIFGVLFDALKPYQFMPGYSERKKHFYSSIGRILGKNSEAGRRAFNNVRMVESGADKTTLFWSHNRWVMMYYASAAFWLGGVVWFSISVFAVAAGEITILGKYTVSPLVASLCNLIPLLIYIAAAKRLNRFSQDEMKKSNNKYLGYIYQHRKQIAKMILEVPQEQRKRKKKKTR